MRVWMAIACSPQRPDASLGASARSRRLQMTSMHWYTGIEQDLKTTPTQLPGQVAALKSFL